jgi:pimeloyl-ACP methyl ester carboxylesterase
LLRQRNLIATSRFCCSFIAILWLGHVWSCAAGDGPSAAAQGAEVWQDSSPHSVRFVAVDEGVQLEVLDWGGRGSPLVLLPGAGLTAHVYDELAPKLTDCCHVYAITRRGFGASSRPKTGYDDQRLADDVLEVVSQLKLVKPVLAGHSMAGGELTTLGNQHSDRLAGLAYIEALDDPGDILAANPEWMRLLQKLRGSRPPPEPRPDYSSFRAYQAWQAANDRAATSDDARQGVFPESELRQRFAANPDGTMGAYKVSTDDIQRAIGSGQKKRDYSRIGVPVLAIRGLVPQRVDDAPRDRGDQATSNDQRRADTEAFIRVTAIHLERWFTNLKAAVPDTHLVDLPGAGHYVFLTKEADVLRELRAFVARLL